MNSGEKVTFAAVLFLAAGGFAGVWFLACKAISSLSGWRRLAAQYPARGEPKGRRFWMQSGRVGKAFYKNCLIIDSASDGLYLRMLFVFRPGHPPIFIPWEEIEIKESTGLWIFASVTCEVGKPPVGTLNLAKRVFEARQQHDSIR